MYDEILFPVKRKMDHFTCAGCWACDPVVLLNGMESLAFNIISWTNKVLFTDKTVMLELEKA